MLKVFFKNYGLEHFFKNNFFLFKTFSWAVLDVLRHFHLDANFEPKTVKYIKN